MADRPSREVGMGDASGEWEARVGVGKKGNEKEEAREGAGNSKGGDGRQGRLEPEELVGNGVMRAGAIHAGEASMGEEEGGGGRMGDRVVGDGYGGRGKGAS